MRTHLTHLTTEIKWIKQYLNRCEDSRSWFGATHNHTLSTLPLHHLYIRNGNASTQAITQRIYTYSHLHFSTYMPRGTVWLYACNASSTAQCFIARICAMCVVFRFENVSSTKTTSFAVRTCCGIYPYNALCICVSYSYRIIRIVLKTVVFLFIFIGFQLQIFCSVRNCYYQTVKAANWFRVIDNNLNN